MAILPRSVCPVCKRDVPVRVTGELREHTNEVSDGTKWTPRKCPGSGQVPRDRKRPIWDIRK
jgi:hypothetical protein